MTSSAAHCRLLKQAQSSSILTIPNHRPTLVLCSKNDDFMLSQDLCFLCGSLGKDEEGNLIACSQCGQCFHPYCVNIKNIKAVINKGWLCQDCNENLEACDQQNDETQLTSDISKENDEDDEDVLSESKMIDGIYLSDVGLKFIKSLKLEPMKKQRAKRNSKLQELPEDDAKRKRVRKLNKIGIGGFSLKPKRVRKTKKRINLADQYPSYLQEAFFGKELLEKEEVSVDENNPNLTNDLVADEENSSSLNSLKHNDTSEHNRSLAIKPENRRSAIIKSSEKDAHDVPQVEKKALINIDETNRIQINTDNNQPSAISEPSNNNDDIVQVIPSVEKNQRLCIEENVEIKRQPPEQSMFNENIVITNQLNNPPPKSTSVEQDAPSFPQMPPSPWVNQPNEFQYGASCFDSSWQALTPGEDVDSMSQSKKNMKKWREDEALGALATSSAVLYTNLIHPNLKQEYPNWPERYKQIVKLWRKLEPDQRKHYTDKARENRSSSKSISKQSKTFVEENPSEEKTLALDRLENGTPLSQTPTLINNHPQMKQSVPHPSTQPSPHLATYPSEHPQNVPNHIVANHPYQQPRPVFAPVRAQIAAPHQQYVQQPGQPPIVRMMPVQNNIRVQSNQMSPQIAGYQQNRPRQFISPAGAMNQDAPLNQQHPSMSQHHQPVNHINHMNQPRMTNQPVHPYHGRSQFIDSSMQQTEGNIQIHQPFQQQQQPVNQPPQVYSNHNMSPVIRRQPPPTNYQPAQQYPAQQQYVYSHNNQRQIQNNFVPHSINSGYQQNQTKQQDILMNENMIQKTPTPQPVRRPSQQMIPQHQISVPNQAMNNQSRMHNQIPPHSPMQTMPQPAISQTTISQQTISQPPLSQPPLQNLNQASNQSFNMAPPTMRLEADDPQPLIDEEDDLKDLGPDFNILEYADPEPDKTSSSGKTNLELDAEFDSYFDVRDHIDTSRLDIDRRSQDPMLSMTQANPIPPQPIHIYNDNQQHVSNIQNQPNAPIQRVQPNHVVQQNSGYNQPRQFIPQQLQQQHQRPIISNNQFVANQQMPRPQNSINHLRPQVHMQQQQQQQQQAYQVQNRPPIQRFVGVPLHTEQHRSAPQQPQMINQPRVHMGYQQQYTNQYIDTSQQSHNPQQQHYHSTMNQQYHQPVAYQNQQQAPQGSLGRNPPDFQAQQNQHYNYPMNNYSQHPQQQSMSVAPNQMKVSNVGLIQDKNIVVGDAVTSVDFNMYEYGSGRENDAVNFPMQPSEANSTNPNQGVNPQNATFSQNQRNFVQYPNSASNTIETNLQNDSPTHPNRAAQGDYYNSNPTTYKQSNLAADVTDHKMNHERNMPWNQAQQVRMKNSESLQSSGGQSTSQVPNSGGGCGQNQLLKQLLGNCSSADNPNETMKPPILIDDANKEGINAQNNTYIQKNISHTVVSSSPYALDPTKNHPVNISPTNQPASNSTILQRPPRPTMTNAPNYDMKIYGPNPPANVAVGQSSVRGIQPVMQAGTMLQRRPDVQTVTRGMPQIQQDYPPSIQHHHIQSPPSQPHQMNIHPHIQHNQQQQKQTLRSPAPPSAQYQQQLQQQLNQHQHPGSQAQPQPQPPPPPPHSDPPHSAHPHSAHISQHPQQISQHPIQSHPSPNHHHPVHIPHQQVQQTQPQHQIRISQIPQTNQQTFHQQHHQHQQINPMQSPLMVPPQPALNSLNQQVQAIPTRPQRQSHFLNQDPSPVPIINQTNGLQPRKPKNFSNGVPKQEQAFSSDRVSSSPKVSTSDKKKNSLAERRAALEREPTPPPKEVKGIKRRVRGPKKRSRLSVDDDFELLLDSDLPAKKRAKKSQSKLKGSEHLSLLTNITKGFVESEISRNDLFACGDLTEPVSRLKGSFGQGQLVYDIGFAAHIQNLKKRHVQIMYSSNHINDFNFGFFGNVIGRDCDSPASIVSESSNEDENVCEGLENKDSIIYTPDINNLISDSLISSKKDDINNNPKLPDSISTPSKSENGLIEHDGKDEQNKENVGIEKLSNDEPALNMMLKDYGNVSVTLTLTKKEMGGIKRILSSLSRLIDYPISQTSLNDCPEKNVKIEDAIAQNNMDIGSENGLEVAKVASKTGLKFDQRNYVPKNHDKSLKKSDDSESNRDAKPKLCFECKTVVLDHGIRKCLEELPDVGIVKELKVSGYSRGFLIFCSVNCYFSTCSKMKNDDVCPGNQRKYTKENILNLLDTSNLNDTKFGSPLTNDYTDTESLNHLNNAYSSNDSNESDSSICYYRPSTNQDETNLNLENRDLSMAVTIKGTKTVTPWPKECEQIKVKPIKPFYKNPSDLIQDVEEPQKSKEINGPLEDIRVCLLCHSIGDGESDGLSRLLSYKQNKWIHLNCALWSLDVYELENGSLMQVDLACKKAMTCSVCQKSGATLKCFKTSCPNYYHFQCAADGRCLFYEDKSVYCNRHSKNAQSKQMQTFVVERRVYIDQDEQMQLAEVVREESQFVVRIGGLILLNIGQLLVHQFHTFHTRDNIFPVGYKVVRYYWSYREFNKRAKYICSILDSGGKPLFRVHCQEFGYDDEQYEGDTAQLAWQTIIDKIVKLRNSVDEFLPAFHPSFRGEDLFGLNDNSIRQILESLPGVETLQDYNFKFGRSPFFELPLAINPTGCARSEPRQKVHVRRSYASIRATGTGGLKSRVPSSNVTEGDLVSPYVKHFVHSKTAQYRKMKNEWRNNVVLARSRVQGLGLFAARDIEKHTMVIEYIGMLIRNEIAERFEQIHEAHNRGIYMFRLDDDRVIDATQTGGLARYINHSCNPNCVAEAIDIDRERKILIIANRKILKGEELGYDYKLTIEDDTQKMMCLCGASTCKKWL